MQELTRREDQIMQVVWQLKRVFIRDIVGALPTPKPHYNTVATIVKVLVKKGVLQSEKFGNMHQYTATLGFEDYRERSLSGIKEKFFDNSFSKMFSHFAKNEDFTDAELEALYRIIKSKKGGLLMND